MPKIVYLTILSVFVFALVTVINISGVRARAATKFVPVSVIAEDQANYGVDKNVNTIPAVSPEIIEDKVHDITLPGSVTTIKYTTLPPKNSGPAGTGKTGDQSTHHNQDNNGNSSVNQNNGQGNDTSNGNQTKGQGSSTNNNNHSTDKSKDKGNKSDKSTSSKTNPNQSTPNNTDPIQSPPKDTNSQKTK